MIVRDGMMLVTIEMMLGMMKMKTRFDRTSFCSVLRMMMRMMVEMTWKSHYESFGRTDEYSLF